MREILGFPAVGRHRRLVAAIGIDALGSGLWMPLSVLYFVVTTDVSLSRIGLVLSVAALLALPFALIGGQLVDRLGVRTVLQAGNLLQAAGFLCYPLVHEWRLMLVVVAVPALGRTLFWGSYSPMVAEISAVGEREKWFGFLGALRNAGFAVGGLVAGVAMALDSVPVFHAIALVNGASFLVSFALLLGTAMRPALRAIEGPAPVETTGHPVGYLAVLQDSGYRWLVAANTGYAMGCLALNVLIPVYLVEKLGLPGWLPGAVYVVNTVMVGLGQGIVVRRMRGTRRFRLVMGAAALMAVGFTLLYAAALTPVPVASALALVAAVIYTLGEMTGGPVLSALAAEAPPAASRGRYLATFQLSWNASVALAPVLFLGLLAQGALFAWGALVLMVALGALCCLPLRSRMPLADAVVTNASVLAA